MKNTIKILLFAAFATVAVFSCRKDDTDDNSKTQCVAGTGGTISVAVFAVHSGDTLLNYESHPDTTFIKFNTTSSAGTSPSNYDTYFVSEAGEDHIHCSHLKCGSYYFYRTAFDSVNNARYTAGFPVTLASDSGNIDTFVNVN